MNLKRAIVALGLSVLATTAHAGVIIDNTYVGTIVNTFDPGATGSVLGFITQTGATYGEKLAGQTLTEGPIWDVLTGTPSAPLTLQSNPDVNDNIGLLSFGGSNVIYGDLSATVGEGAVSILFGTGTSGLGFNVSSAPMPARSQCSSSISPARCWHRSLSLWSAAMHTSASGQQPGP